MLSALEMDLSVGYFCWHKNDYFCKLIALLLSLFLSTIRLVSVGYSCWHNILSISCKLIALLLSLFISFTGLVIYCLPMSVTSPNFLYLQGECWFDPKISVDSSSKDCKLVNSSETLKERLRTLQENASLFARGCVFKNNVKVVNQQPDYEFFISRKS